MKDPLETVARELWKNFGFTWEKIRLHKSDEYDDSYVAEARFPSGEILEYVDLHYCDAEESSNEPALLRYVERGTTLKVISDSDFYRFVPLGRNNQGTRTLHCYIEKEVYNSVYARLQKIGGLAKLFTIESRRGNPDIVNTSEWFVKLDNFEGVEDIFKAFITSRVNSPKPL